MPRGKKITKQLKKIEDLDKRIDQSDAHGAELCCKSGYIEEVGDQATAEKFIRSRAARYGGVTQVTLVTNASD